jgi:hypothetical protein
MNVYQHYLPQAFPYRVLAPRYTIYAMVDKLITGTRNDGATHGSSFAVTVDLSFGKIWLWLSKVSFDYLHDEGYFELYKNKIELHSGPPLGE